MARGWESKSVQEQQDAAEMLPRERRRLNAEQTTLFRQQQGLWLSRTSVLRRLESVQDSGHRKMLEGALADLDAKLAKLGPVPGVFDDSDHRK